MRKDWHISGTLQLEETFIEPRRGDVMRGFHEHIAGIGQGEQVSALESLDEIRGNMHVGPGDQIKADAALIEFLLQGRDPPSDIRTAIWPNAWKNMGGAGHHPDPIGHGRPRHLQRDLQVGRTIVNSRQEMAVEVNHRRAFWLRTLANGWVANDCFAGDRLAGCWRGS